MDVGPVLDIEDLAGWKTVALASRVEPRDYVDIAAALDHYTIDELIALARRLDPGLQDRDFTDAGRQLDRMPDGLFAATARPRGRRPAAGAVRPGRAPSA